MTVQSSQAPQTITPQPGERTIGQLVADTTNDLQELVRSEVALAKAEVQEGIKVMGMGAGLLGAAAFLGLIGLIFVFHTVALVLAIWLPVWAGYAIITALLLVAAVILALVGKSRLSGANPVPERAIAQAQETVQSLGSLRP